MEEVVVEGSEAEVVLGEAAQEEEVIEEGAEVVVGEVIEVLPEAAAGEVQGVAPEEVSALAHPSSTTHDLPTRRKSKENTRYQTEMEILLTETGVLRRRIFPRMSPTFLRRRLRSQKRRMRRRLNLVNHI